MYCTFSGFVLSYKVKLFQERLNEMEKELVIQKATYINDRSYIPLTVLAANQQQKYIELLTAALKSR